MGSISAAASGADIIEKHISLNKKIGTDSKFSLEIKDLQNFVSMCKSAYRTKGRFFMVRQEMKLNQLSQLEPYFLEKIFQRDI